MKSPKLLQKTNLLEEDHVISQSLKQERINLIKGLLKKLKDFVNIKKSTLGNSEYYGIDQRLCDTMDDAEASGYDVSRFRDKYKILVKEIDKINGPLFLKSERNLRAGLDSYELTEAGYFAKQKEE